MVKEEWELRVPETPAQSSFSLLGLLSALLICFSSSGNTQHLQSARSFLPPKISKPVSLAALGTHVEMSPGDTCEVRVWYPMQDLQHGQEPLDACPWGAGASSPPACGQGSHHSVKQDTCL